MKLLKSMAIMVALVAGSAGLASAQYGPRGNWGYQDRDHDRDHDWDRDGDRDRNHDWDRNRSSNSNAYQEGYRQGQWDARHNRRAQVNNGRWGHNDDRRAYAVG